MFIVNVEGAINKNGKWLLVKRSEKEEHAGGLLSLIGGKVEKEGASIDILERTLHREIGEEVGIEVANLRYVTSSSFVTDSGLNVVNVVFVCDYKSGEAIAKCPDEVDEVVWMSTQEIVGHPAIPVYLKDYINLADKLVGGNPAAVL
ncbi:NUDIX domain-containing protein [Neobacillus sp. YIM B06451]|uniref:NUDIX hydrolase n=1 Tax=Neobacillus sp. YIM B06451 TaxID=3070994 RepID=UPI002931F06B|nr:NUDIX domain-containing protein [Neobacillus sp. YIM B06451]